MFLRFLLFFAPYGFISLPLLLIFVSAAYGANAPRPLPGWSEYDLQRETYKTGVSLAGGSVGYSSPVAAEIDGDAANGLEIVVAGADGIVHAYSSNGVKLWSRTLKIYGCPHSSSSNKIFSSPAVGALFGDGVPYVVIGYGGFGSGGIACGGGVVAIRGYDGKLRWNFNLKKFAQQHSIPRFSYAVFSTPALADIDNNGRLAVGFGSFSRYSFLLEPNGQVRWYYCNADTVWSSPAFADTDGDGRPEMIIGSDITRNDNLHPPTPNGGYVVALSTKKRSNKHIWFRDRSAVKWETYFDQTIMSSPVIADVLPGNPGPELIIGSGCYFPENSANKLGKWFKILRLRDGKVLQTLVTPTCSSSSAAVGDIDEDGTLEVVAIVNGSKSVGGPGQSRLMAWKATDPNPLWSTVPKVQGQNDPFAGDFKSPIIADLDGNGSLEVIVANGVGLAIFSGRDGTALTCQDRTCTADDSILLFASGSLKNTPAAADIDGDGTLELITAGSSRASSIHGGLYVWGGFAEVLGSEAGSLAPYSAPWPMFRGNPTRSGMR